MAACAEDVEQVVGSVLIRTVARTTGDAHSIRPSLAVIRCLIFDMDKTAVESYHF